MGELRGAELTKCMAWWKTAYKDANEVTPEERQEYLDYHNEPRELVQQWDAERA